LKFLLPLGGITDNNYGGIITSPAHGGIVKGIKDGMNWAADNEAFTRGFNPNRFFSWLEKMEEYKSTCLFVSVPDVVGNAIATLEQWRNWVVRFNGWPLAFVAQDGQEDLPFPDEDTFTTLFIGGSTEWKLSQGAVTCIKRAQAMQKHIHIGRVNYNKRYKIFRMLQGSEEFTCDGTRTRWGREKALNDWKNYQLQQPLFTI